MSSRTGTSSRLEKGKNGEDSALQYLAQRGLRLRERNYHCHFGELDLIMQEHDYIVFIEVRLRNHRSHGTALESISRSKVRKIILTATHYLQQQKLLYTAPCRFDIIAIQPNAQPLQLEWIKNAFTLDP